MDSDFFVLFIILISIPILLIINVVLIMVSTRKISTLRKRLDTVLLRLEKITYKNDLEKVKKQEEPVVIKPQENIVAAKLAAELTRPSISVLSQVDLNKETQDKDSADRAKITESEFTDELKGELPVKESLKPSKLEKEIPLKSSSVIKSKEKSEKEKSEQIKSLWNMDDKVKEPAIKKQKSEFERKAIQVFSKIWNWIVVGEEHRPANVSVEYAVATVWLIRSAVLLVLIGLGFLAKYSHDNKLLAPEIRISLLIVGGLAIIGVGWKLARSERFQLLGYAFSGVGVVTLYFSIFAACSIYKILPVEYAFFTMFLVTIFGAILALRLNAVFVALIVVIGGYATPVMLSTGVKNFPGLFSYMLLLSVGIMFMSFYRNWRLLIIVTFLLNTILFGGSYLRDFDAGVSSDFWNIIIFGSVFFVMFSIIPLCYSLINKVKITLIETLMLIAAVGFYFYFGIMATQKSFVGMKYEAGVTIFAALIYLAMIEFCRYRKNNDKNLYLSLLVLASFSVSLTLPLLLSDCYLTAAWSIQAALMLFLGKRTDSRFLSLLAIIVYIVTGVSAINNLPVYSASYLTEMLERLVSMGTYVLTLAFGGYILRPSKSPEVSSSEKSVDILPKIENLDNKLFPLLMWGTALFLFVFLRFEISRCPLDLYKNMKIMLCAILYLGSFIFLCKNAVERKSKILFGLTSFILVYMLIDLVYMVFNYRSCVIYWEESIFRIFAFLIFALGLFFIGRNVINKLGKKADLSKNGSLFVISGIIIWFVYSSGELFTGLDFYFTKQIASGGLTVLWAVYAFVILVSGITYRYKVLRYIALILFGVVVFKALIYDMAALAALYRIFAFIVVGILFFLGAFAYMRVDKIFKTEEESDSVKER